LGDTLPKMSDTLLRGAGGVRSTLQLEKTGGKRGLGTLCIGVGMGSARVVERV